MGLFDDDDPELDALLESVKKYPSCVVELNEGNVQAIFNRCLATTKTNITSPTVLFPVVYGYEPEDEILIQFDKEVLLKNKQSIEYLYGQLGEVHRVENTYSGKVKHVTLEDFSTSYLDAVWTKDRSVLIKFLYLGCNAELLLLKPFNKKYRGTDMSTSITPTLSPKDPNFPAWWEAHKTEWEQ